MVKYDTFVAVSESSHTLWRKSFTGYWEKARRRMKTMTKIDVDYRWDKAETFIILRRGPKCIYQFANLGEFATGQQHLTQRFIGAGATYGHNACEHATKRPAFYFTCQVCNAKRCLRFVAWLWTRAWRWSLITWSLPLFVHQCVPSMFFSSQLFYYYL